MSTREPGHSFIRDRLNARGAGTRGLDISRKKRKCGAGRLIARAKGVVWHDENASETSFEPGVLASVMPEGLGHVNAYLPWWINGRGQLRESR